MFTAKHWKEVRDPYGTARGRIEKTEGDDDTIDRLTVSTNLELWELPRLNHQESTYTNWSQTLRIYVANVCLVWPQWEGICIIL